MANANPVTDAEKAAKSKRKTDAIAFVSNLISEGAEGYRQKALTALHTDFNYAEKSCPTVYQNIKSGKEGWKVA